ncbi:hypothetical protein C8R44DRAFT_724436 [Mycena epipterygia]|nr:hypothetical protein C8R44DRAFT_724436 [Mycena epipterygia]
MAKRLCHESQPEGPGCRNHCVMVAVGRSRELAEAESLADMVQHSRRTRNYAEAVRHQIHAGDEGWRNERQWGNMESIWAPVIWASMFPPYALTPIGPTLPPTIAAPSPTTRQHTNDEHCFPTLRTRIRIRIIELHVELAVVSISSDCALSSVVKECSTGSTQTWRRTWRTGMGTQTAAFVDAQAERRPQGQGSSMNFVSGAHGGGGGVSTEVEGVGRVMTVRDIRIVVRDFATRKIEIFRRVDGEA